MQSNAQFHLVFGLAALVVGLVLALIGQQVVSPEHAHPIGTGLIAVGIVATGVALVERRPLGTSDDRTSDR